jgi:uncharacterized SAM-binding protein YcdF (DUF218 family)
MLKRIKRPSWTLIFSIVAILGLIGLRAFTQAGLWISEADRPGKMDVIVCLNGSERVKKAAELYHQGLAPKVILTAGKDKKDLVRMGIPENRITLAEWPMTTFQEALAVASIDHRSPFRSAIVVTDPFHIERVRWTFNHVFKGKPIRFEVVSSDFPFVKKHWWKDKMSRFYVFSEISKLTYYEVVHGLLRVDQEPPWVVALKHRYQQWLLDLCQKGTGLAAFSPDRSTGLLINENQLATDLKFS